MPRELFLIVDAHNESRHQQRRDMITQAYLTAAWSRAQKLPKLESILSKTEQANKPKREKSADEMLDFIKRLQAESEVN